MKTILAKGFTLIELLVVVAIVGIIASVIVANLGTSRNRTINAHIRTSLAQMRTQTSLYYSDNFNYGGAIGGCGAGAVFQDLKFISIRLAMESAAGANAVCQNSATSWAVYIPTKPDGTLAYLCTDATGVIKAYTSSPTPNISGSTCN